MTRPLFTIAQDIHDDWAPTGIYFGARPYLDAMFTLDDINDRYLYDSGRSIVLYFLNNAKRWRTPTAKRIKAELKGML